MGQISRNKDIKRKRMSTNVAIAGLTAVMLGASFGLLSSAASAIPDDGNRGTEGSVGAPSDGGSSSIGSSSDSDNDERRKEEERKKREALRAKHEAETKARQAAEAAASDNLVALNKPKQGNGLTLDSDNNVAYGDVAGALKLSNPPIPTKPANDPFRGTVKSASKCDFESGTTNLDDTKKLFPEECGESWHPERHKCDYSDDGWRCYAL